jgi:transposase
MLFVRAYPRETQEIVFDAHDRAFALFEGSCGRGIYDNMKTAVETVFIGKGRVYNRRFLQMCSHFGICAPIGYVIPWGSRPSAWSRCVGAFSSTAR